MTPYVTNGPQIDYPDGQSAQDFSIGMDDSIIHLFDGVHCLGVEKDVSWMSIPAGTNTRKHGWRDVVSLIDCNQVPKYINKNSSLHLITPLQVYSNKSNFDWSKNSIFDCKMVND